MNEDMNTAFSNKGLHAERVTSTVVDGDYRPIRASDYKSAISNEGDHCNQIITGTLHGSKINPH